MENKKKLIREIGRYGTIGLEMVISVVIGLLFGWWMDSLLHTKPWLTLVFMLFGVAAGFKGLFRVLKLVKKNGLIDKE
ncbi:MAG: AtpZ/AtpI family protein [Thermodesulfobacteriota bacterium]|nr:AtpZ/AtpI family protein [Thermodesulfobacteriota bacterium]